MRKFMKEILGKHHPVLLQKLSLTALILFFAVATGVAQSTYGTLQGTVTDSSGAVIGGAKIDALNEATGAVRTTTSDGAGDYRLVNLDPGAYTLTVSAANFGTVKDEHITLPSRETVRADIKLSVKSTAQEVVVTANQDIITEELTQSNSLSGTEISSLPLNFRATNNPSPIQAAILTPTVNEDSGGNLTFAGQVPTATSFSLDGISIQQTRVGGPTKDLYPSVEGIDEFRVNTAGGDAEYAQPTDLTVTTKSGSSHFHGSGFWFAQRKGWDSTDQVAKYYPSGNANTFGASLGGPIWAGSHLKDKAFFYFDYEGVRLANNTELTSQTVPAAWLNGDFTGEGAGGAGASGLQLTTPTGAVLPSNNLALDGLSVSPIAAIAFKNFFPTPAGPNAGSDNLDSGALNLQQVFPGQYTSDVYDGRIDYHFNARHSIFGRVTKKNITSAGTDSATGDSTYNPLMGTFTTGSDLTNVAFSHNWVVNSHLINEARGGWSIMDFSYTFPQAEQGDAIIQEMETAGLSEPPGIAGGLGHPANGLGGVPVFYTGNLLGGQGSGTNDFGHPRLNNNSVFEIGDIVTYSKGPLDIKVGGSFRRVAYRDNITFLNGDEYGDYFNDGAITCQSAQDGSFFDACSVAELWLGLQDGASLAQNGPDGKPYSHHFDGFGQFDWKVNQRLTVNLGLRYEVNTPFIDQTNQLGQFDTSIPKGELIVNRNEKISKAWAEAVGDVPATSTAGLPTVGTSTGIPGIPFTYASSVGLGPGLRYLDATNIQPRVGAIWKPFPTSDTVVKASAGVYSVPVLGAVLYSLLGVDTSNFGSYGPAPYTSVFSGTGSAGAFPGYRRANQWDLKDPSVAQWNLSVEQNVGYKTDLKLSYTGSHSWNLIYSPDLNQVVPNTTGYANLVSTPDLRLQNLKFPNFREVLTRANGPWDNYNSFSIEANRRFAQGLSYTNAYTFTSNNTNALGTAPSSAIASGGQGDNGGNVNNAFDIRSDYGHAFYDPRHKLLSTVVYNLPIGRGQMLIGDASPVLDRIIGGWSMTAINLYHSGNFLTPYYPSGDYDSSGTKPSNRSVSQQRPDIAAGVSLSPTPAQHAAGLRYNVNAFEFPGSTPGGPAPSAPIGRFGNAGVGILTGPGTETFSTSIGKNLPIAEHFVLRYECQVSNLFNFVNYANPGTNITSPGSFGLSTSSQSGSQAGPRTIQMSLRLSY